MGTVYVGTSGWSYPRGNGRWDGVFYPSKLPDKDKLAYYADFFNAVEINSSFYRPPNPNAARGWAERVPDRFRFTAKLWQKFTHPKMFEEATGRAAEISNEDFEVYLAGIEPLASAGKLGPVLAQFPPSFRPQPGSLEYLEDLLRRLQAEGLRVALELRHREWTDPEHQQAVRDLLHDEHVAWVMIDEPRFRTSIGEVPLTSSVGYFRFHGRNFENWWRKDAGEERYNYLYPSDEQRELASDVNSVAERTGETYAFYNNHYGAKAVVNALQLKMALGEQPPTVQVPASLLKDFPSLEDLLARGRSS